MDLWHLLGLLLLYLGVFRLLLGLGHVQVDELLVLHSLLELVVLLLIVLHDLLPHLEFEIVFSRVLHDAQVVLEADHTFEILEVLLKLLFWSQNFGLSSR